MYLPKRLRGEFLNGFYSTTTRQNNNRGMAANQKDLHTSLNSFKI